jgi:nucleotide-binding universal stress UspA family protein
MHDGDNLSETIMVAQDGSPAAQAAEDMAVEIARYLDLSVKGLYIVDETMILDTCADYVSELNGADYFPTFGRRDVPNTRTDLVYILTEQGYSAIRSLKNHCRAALVQATADLLVGDVTTIVIRESQRAFLLALGRRGRLHADEPRRLGSHFRAIARHLPLPLLIGGTPNGRIKRLLLAYNDNPHARRAMELACRLQRSRSMEMVVLGVHEGKDESLVQHWLVEARERLREQNIENYHIATRFGLPAQEIAGVAAETGSSLIIMGGYRHSPLIQWIVGSTLDQVLRTTHLPVLVG